MPTGLYLSRCRGRLDGTVDADAVARRFEGQAEVVRIVDDFFDPDVQIDLLADIADHGLDAVVLAGNLPERYRRSLAARYLRERITSAGVSPSRVVGANLLEQVAMAHPGDPDAQAKAEAVVAVAMLQASISPELEWRESVPERAVLILGATSEGFVAALRLLELHFKVIIADRADGSVRARSHSMAATGAHLLGHPSCTFVDDATFKDGMGWVGDYDVVLGTPDGDVGVHVGGVLIAEPHSADWVAELRPHFRVDVDEEGNARSIDPASHPAETVAPGIMVVPLRSADAPVRDKVAAADSAALALMLKLSQSTTKHYIETSQVDESLCGGCASCVKTCIFGACYIGEDGLSHVDPRRCRGCGKCVVGCPVGARDIVVSPHAYLTEAISQLAEVEVHGERVLGFLCGGCGYPAADDAGKKGVAYPASFLPLRIPCGGRLDTLYVLEAFKAGFDGVVVFRCREGHCHNLIGNLDMDRRLNLLRTVLRSRGIDDSRLRMVDISPDQGEQFGEAVGDLYSTLDGLANGKEASSERTETRYLRARRLHRLPPLPARRPRGAPGVARGGRPRGVPALGRGALRAARVRHRARGGRGGQRA